MRRYLSVLAACVVGLAATSATAKVVVLKGDGEDMILSVSSSEPGESANATFICNGKTSQFGIVLAPGSAAAGGADVTIKADATVLGQRHFDQFQKSLMLTADGEQGHALLEKATGAETIEMDVAGKPFRFALGDGKTEVARYRAACGL